MATPARFYFTYQDLMRLTDKSYNAVCQDVRRGTLDCDKLDSVVIWLARHGRMEMQGRIAKFALERLLPDELPGESRRVGKVGKKARKDR